jgi:hypothetical protein
MVSGRLVVGSLKVVLVGQAPPHYGSNEFALYPAPTGCAGWWLCRYMGLEQTEYLRLFERTNVLSRFPGKLKSGDKFPMAEAVAASGPLAAALGGRRVVLVGKQVATAFGMGGNPMAVFGPHRGFTGAWVPHPSGRNRMWNDPAVRVIVAEFFAGLVDMARGAVNAGG